MVAPSWAEISAIRAAAGGVHGACSGRQDIEPAVGGEYDPGIGGTSGFYRVPVAAGNHDTDRGAVFGYREAAQVVEYLDWTLPDFTRRTWNPSWIRMTRGAPD
jgi:hypothetical protein